MVSGRVQWSHKEGYAMREIQQKAHYAERLRPYDIDAADCRCLFFAAGETLIRQGEPVESLYFIVKGRVEALVLQ